MLLEERERIRLAQQQDREERQVAAPLEIVHHIGEPIDSDTLDGFKVPNSRQLQHYGPVLR